MRGFLVIDKPVGLTSHDLVGILRACTGIKRIGHTGTLDPFATGVLPLAIGPATRLIQFLDEGKKVYLAELKLGERTDTADRDGQVVESAPVPELSDASIDAALAEMTGPQEQLPPMYSAIKVNGKRLYEYARKGQTVERTPRPITVYRAERVAVDGDRLVVRFEVSRGTYVRVLGEDLAERLGTLGHLSALRREASGSFALDGSVSMDELAGIAGMEPGPWQTVFSKDRDARAPWKDRAVIRPAVSERLLGLLPALAPMRVVEVDAVQAARVRTGVRFAIADVAEGERVLLSHADKLLAVAEGGTERIRYLRVVPPEPAAAP